MKVTSKIGAVIHGIMLSLIVIGLIEIFVGIRTMREMRESVSGALCTLLLRTGTPFVIRMEAPVWTNSLDRSRTYTMENDPESNGVVIKEVEIDPDVNKGETKW